MALLLTWANAMVYPLSLQEAELPLWLRPFDVLVTSNKTALIELIPDALSIHTIKAKSLPGTTLVDHFMAMHGQVSVDQAGLRRSARAQGAAAGRAALAGSLVNHHPAALKFVEAQHCCYD